MEPLSSFTLLCPHYACSVSRTRGSFATGCCHQGSSGLPDRCHAHTVSCDAPVTLRLCSPRTYRRQPRIILTSQPVLLANRYVRDSLTDDRYSVPPAHPGRLHQTRCLYSCCGRSEGNCCSKCLFGYDALGERQHL